MTTKNKQLDEKFESSFDVPAELPDAVDKGSNKRPADKDGQKDPPKALTKAQMISGMTHKAYKLSHPELTDKYREFFAMGGENVSDSFNRATIKAGGLKEDIDTVFEGAELSEEAREKVTTIFEAAVNAAIVQETARLEEEFEAKLEESIAEQVGTLSEALEQYLDYVAEQWLEENKLQVETGLRSDIAEAFLAGLKGLFVEHYVEVPEEAVDVVEALTTQVEELTASLNESKNEVIAVRSQLEEAARTAAVATVAEGLTETQREKLQTLSEDLSYDDSFQTKLTQIKESLIEKKEVVPADKQLNEEVDIEAAGNTVVVDPIVAAAKAALGRRK